MGPDGLSLIRTRLKKINSIHKINESTTICQFKFFLNRIYLLCLKSAEKKKRKGKAKHFDPSFVYFHLFGLLKTKTSWIFKVGNQLRNLTLIFRFLYYFL
jgi:hypothetical protein